jgi:hypothetical protein
MLGRQAYDSHGMATFDCIGKACGTRHVALEYHQFRIHGVVPHHGRRNRSHIFGLARRVAPQG